jgi:hypothetical protein
MKREFRTVDRADQVGQYKHVSRRNGAGGRLGEALGDVEETVAGGETEIPEEASPSDLRGLDSILYVCRLTARAFTIGDLRSGDRTDTAERT